MSDEPEVIENDEEEVQQAPGWFKFIVTIAVIAIVIGCAGWVYKNTSLAGERITLSGAEREKAIGLAEHRQKIAFERQEAQNEFQTKINRFAEEENALNVEAAKLCFELKKSHKLNPTSNYILNEWAGELEKR